jgi:UDP-N-acetylglucosamine--N-acetylmuramyl-(pentapeptide) pyrophosphoryl-undecaprenol N-acetylglucosamine transferase
MKIVITGGHFSPAYSIIQKMKANNEILVIGRKYAFEGDKNETFEYKACQSLGIPFVPISTGRLQRVLTKHTVPSLFKFPQGIYSSIKILRKFEPDVVVTFGGYVALPVALAASILKIPVVLHEQTLKMGLSSRLISKFAKVICISYESSRGFFKGKNVVLTGNPIREEVLQKNNSLDISKSKPLIYITGGSTGAHFINSSVKTVLPKLLNDFTIVHHTGNSAKYNDYESLLKFRESLDEKFKDRYIISQFFKVEEVSWLFRNASLVISRSGINTITELMAVGCVSLLIPLPFGQINEQMENAKFFKRIGLGEYIEQKNLTPEEFLNLIYDMIKKREKYLSKAVEAKKYIHLDAADKIIEQIKIYGGEGPTRRKDTF